jgi:hypothetical protein
MQISISQFCQVHYYCILLINITFSFPQQKTTKLESEHFNILQNFKSHASKKKRLKEKQKKHKI